MEPFLRRYLLVVYFFIFLAVFQLSRATEKEKTLAMIKPDGLEGNYSDTIKKIILASGFTIVSERTIQLDEDTVRTFYVEHSSKSFFPSLIKYMTSSGPVLAMVLEKENAVADWRSLIGPTDAEKAKVTHPHRTGSASEQYVGSVLKGIVCTVQIQSNPLQGSYRFSLGLMEQGMMSCEGSVLCEGVSSSSASSSNTRTLNSKSLTSQNNTLTMKFFNWMQNKINGRPGNQKLNTTQLNNQPKQPPQREEFSDWPHGLLTIGTFGNNELKDRSNKSEIQTVTDEHEQAQEQNPTTASSPDLSEFTPEEVGKLQKELTKLLKRKPAKQEEENPDLPLDRFLNCPSSLEVSRRISNAVCTDPEYKEDDIERTISVIIGKCKEVRAEKTKNAIGKKSLSFLLKKMFVCANGFSPAPSLRDTLQESRMEKLLRTILHKKIYQQSSSRASSMKRYLEDKHTSKKRSNEDETEEKPRASEGCKWDKSDSEYIVLEI